VRVDAGRRREAGAPIESVLLNDAVPGDSFLGSLEVLNVQEKAKTVPEIYQNGTSQVAAPSLVVPRFIPVPGTGLGRPKAP
jgi:hypothetical protein